MKEEVISPEWHLKMYFSENNLFGPSTQSWQKKLEERFISIADTPFFQQDQAFRKDSQGIRFYSCHKEAIDAADECTRLYPDVTWDAGYAAAEETFRLLAKVVSREREIERAATLASHLVWVLSGCTQADKTARLRMAQKDAKLMAISAVVSDFIEVDLFPGWEGQRLWHANRFVGQIWAVWQAGYCRAYDLGGAIGVYPATSWQD